jgi:RHS repeat-associated protein
MKHATAACTSNCPDGNASESEEAAQRRYNRRHARFDRPDPYDGSYDLSDPQSLNRYAYTQGDPVNFTDPTGLMPNLFPQMSGAEYGYSGFGGWGGGWDFNDRPPGSRSRSSDCPPGHICFDIHHGEGAYYVIDFGYYDPFAGQRGGRRGKPVRPKTPEKADWQKYEECKQEAHSDYERRKQGIEKRYAGAPGSFTPSGNTVGWGLYTAGGRYLLGTIVTSTSITVGGAAGFGILALGGQYYFNDLLPASDKLGKKIGELREASDDLKSSLQGCRSRFSPESYGEGSTLIP